MTTLEHHGNDILQLDIVVRVVLPDPVQLLIVGDHVDLDADLVGCLHSLRSNGLDQPVLLLIALLLEALLVRDLLLNLAALLLGHTLVVLIYFQINYKPL